MQKIKLFELKENETWDESWFNVGLFSSEEQVKNFKLKRIEKLKKDFNQGSNSFESWYNWSVNERYLSIFLPEEVQHSICELKKKDAKDWNLDDCKTVANFFLNNFNIEM